MGFFGDLGGSIDKITSNVSDRITSMTDDISKKATDLFSGGFDSSSIRRAAAGLFPGAATSIPRQLSGMLGGSSASPSAATPGGTNSLSPNDWRLKVGIPNGAKYLYQGGSPLLNPLVETDGVVFPYTPSVSVSYKANYSSQKLTHSNYASFSYESSEVEAINITGDFTVQTHSEGLYLFAAIHFFRSATKMFFGDGQNSGNPPPILVLSGYGDAYFPFVNCVLTSFQHVLPQDVDYVPINLGTIAGIVRLPTTSQITISMQPVYSRRMMRDFDFNAFAKGDLLGRGFM